MTTKRQAKQEGGVIDISGRGIPITFAAALILQTSAMVWAIRGTYSQLEQNTKDLVALKTTVEGNYTKEDARRDRDLVDLKLQSYSQRDGEFERRVSALERAKSFAELRMDQEERARRAPGQR